MKNILFDMVSRVFANPACRDYEPEHDEKVEHDILMEVAEDDSEVRQ